MVARHKEEGVLHHVFQLPDIPWKAVAVDAVHRFPGKAAALLVLPPVDPVDEIAAKGLNILPAFPQGRDMDGDNIQTVEEILPEMLLLDQRRQIPVGGGDNPGV